MNYYEESLNMHKQWHGKLDIVAVPELETTDDLAIAYTPGVAAPCLDIQKDPHLSYEYTMRGNLCAVITDGTAVLGLGNIGPEASIPVMEGKCALFKKFGNVNAIPICVDAKTTDEFVETVYNISKSFGGINLEDISAPHCFEVESRLKELCDIPIFHDDQHGTAVIVLAGLINALKLVGKKAEDIRIVTSGAGAAGTAIVKLLLGHGFSDVTMCDRHGVIYPGRDNLNPAKSEMAKLTNPDISDYTGESGEYSLAEALVGADVFIGTSATGLVSKEMVASMNKDAIIFACANPEPEIMPEDALAAGARVVSTGRSDFHNQINNVLAFPGIFRGTFDAGAHTINEEMKLAAAMALASLVSDDELSEEYIIPSALDDRVAPAVASAVAEAAVRSGATR